MRKNLTQKDFFDVYGISLLSQATYLIPELSPRLFEIAKKYIDITDYALRSELRHIKQCMITDNKVKKIYHARKNLKLDRIIAIFSNGEWDCDYGGLAWANIAEGLKELIKTYNKKDFNATMLAIDHLNDLEHNNALYLKSYCQFHVRSCLDLKQQKETCSDDIFARCSVEIKQLAQRSKVSINEYRTKGDS
ncbi:MAG: hypothetical protein ACREBJ_08170 [Nitrosotalea sp.]